MTMRKTALAAITAALLLLPVALAGCTGATSASDSASSSTRAGKSTGVTIDPLAAMLEETGREARAQKEEQSIKSCMEAQGFEYSLPELPGSDDASVTGSVLGAIRSREVAAQYGYGLTEEAWDESDAADNHTDPNSLYQKSLSDSEQVAYWKALDGSTPPSDSSAPPEQASDSDFAASCTGKAQKASGPSQEARPPIIDDANDFLLSLVTSPKITAIQDEVAQCMSDLGYSDGYQHSLEDEIFAYAAEHPSATPNDPEVMRLKEKDIKTAVDEWDCQHKVDYFARGFAALADLEKDYIAEHKGELEEAQLWLNQ